MEFDEQKILSFFKTYTNNPKTLTDWLERAKNNEPLTKIVEERAFWKDVFYINQDVLDPRFDTETLIEAVLKTYPDINYPYRFIDLGTGSGCVIISLLREYKNASGVAIDICKKALTIAKKNAKELEDRITFVCSDWLEQFRPNEDDIIVSNPPYIRDDYPLDSSVTEYDPSLALYGGQDGLDAYRKIFQKLKTVGFFEIGYDQIEAIKKLAKDYGLTVEKTFKDLQGIFRVVKVVSKI